MAEVAAVFVGVALAFVAENLREDLQEQATAHELAAGMLEDLDLTLEDLTRVRARTRLKIEASLAVREHLRSSVPTVSLDSLSGLLATSAGTLRQAPVLRSYEQLVSTGLLRRLSSESRRAIAEWIAALETSREYFEQDLVDFRQTVGFPFFVRSSVSLDQMMTEYEAIRELGLELGEARFPHSWADLHDDRELNDVLVSFAVLSFATEDSYADQERKLQSLIDVLRQELL